MMIESREELKKYIEADQVYWRSYSLKKRLQLIITNDHLWNIQKFMKLLRKQEYYLNKKCILWKIVSLLYARRKNTLGNKLSFYICPNTLGKGTIIFHHGTIIIHGDARLGENCRLHGNNCIGNNGISNDAPIIGNDVDIGFGAQVLGNVQLADQVKVGSGAVVVKSCLASGATIVGVPAKPVN
jgi:serine O-acetyltransferase